MIHNWEVTMDLNLAGKHALVTGGSRGIGRAIALALAEQGVSVAACYHSESEDVRSLATELERYRNGSYVVQVDISSKESVARMAESVRQRFGKLNILVNNAGVISHIRLPLWSSTSGSKLLPPISPASTSSLTPRRACLWREARSSTLARRWPRLAFLPAPTIPLQRRASSASRVHCAKKWGREASVSTSLRQASLIPTRPPVFRRSSASATRRWQLWADWARETTSPG